MKNIFKTLIALLLCLVCLVVATVAYGVHGVVIDSHNKPLSGAWVSFAGNITQTDSNGEFKLANNSIQNSSENLLIVRQIGFKRSIVSVTDDDADITIKLEEFTPKALYISARGIGSKLLLNRALTFVDRNAINALVIDVKDDVGIIPWPSDVETAKQIGARNLTTVRDPQSFIKKLKDKNIYLIARIVVFKDILLAQANPDWAIKTKNGDVYVDREHLQWIDPSIEEAWDYSLAVAKEAAELGFDEIQFDYIRFPDTRGVVFSVPNTQENRVASINGYLDKAREVLNPYNVFISADVFGYICWNKGDTLIGQQLETIIDHVDYLAPMLYPSGFQFGIPGYRNPAKNPYEIVYLSLVNALKRTDVSPLRFRPWLQSFRDYAFGQPFGSAELERQIDAANKAGTNGFMIWNARNIYPEAIKDKLREEE